jgi:hypothetical protein
MANISALIEGLSILQRYEPTADVYGVSRSVWSIEVNEQEFDQISQEDRRALQNLGWRSAGVYRWRL